MAAFNAAEAADLKPAEFALPGPLRDALNAAILDGTTTSTTSLVAEYKDEPLPGLGERQALLDSEDTPIAVIETVGLRIVTLAEVDLDHARREGEGHEDVASWRGEHERFWHGEEFREAIGDPEFRVTDSTLVVLEDLRCLGPVLDGPGTGRPVETA